MTGPKVYTVGADVCPMGNEQKWIEVVKRAPAWVSGGISLATAMIGFVLLLQGNVGLGVTVLGVLLAALLSFGLAYVAFARTPPLIEGGRGVYRFERLRPWALLGLGVVAGLVASALLFEGSREFVVTAITGREGAGPAERGDVLFADDCFEATFAGVGDGRVATLEKGATAQVVLESDQTKGEAAGLYLTDFGRPVGAVTYHVFPESDLFRIESLVDGGCEEVGGYAGMSLPSADPVEVRLGEAEYILDMVYDGGAVYASFRGFSR